MKRYVSGERGLGILANQPGAPGRRTGPDILRLEQHDGDTGASQAPRGSRAGESTADNDDPGV